MSLHLGISDSLSFPLATKDLPASRFAGPSQAGTRQCNDEHSRFEIYRAELVSLTSTLFGGGDWRWRLTTSAGAVVADCGGYRNEAQCRAAVELLRAEAGLATVSRQR